MEFFIREAKRLTGSNEAVRPGMNISELITKKEAERWQVYQAALLWMPI